MLLMVGRLSRISDSEVSDSQSGGLRSSLGGPPFVRWRRPGRASRDVLFRRLAEHCSNCNQPSVLSS
jgi:hypothetical protein